ncbi:terminase large subunit domain-containing protein, partial [Priestia megaterium]|uniref:terminase large subunit domain-containing protein n=1 Tax=Priestia megaterium TaxID=1404 RepID=UPI002E2193E3|nr:terminase family protein [Priestia megaterium]
MTNKKAKEQKLAEIQKDPARWLLNFVKIQDNENNYIPFAVNDQQLQFINEMSKYNIIAKARQIGFSTLSLGLCLWMACTRPRTNYLIVSYKQDSATSLFDKLKMMYEDLPHGKYPNLFPEATQNNRGQLRLANNSSITLSVAGGKDIGRGTTYEYILLSEFAFYDNQESILISSEQALAKNTTSRVVIETTSNGFNHYQKIFMNAYKKQSKYKAFFFPFFSSSYAQQFKVDYEIAEKWYKANNKGKRLTKDDLDDEELNLLEMGAKLKQLMWRRWKILDSGTKAFYQEFPAHPMQSFISTGNNVFDTDLLVQRIPHVMKVLTFTEVKDVLPEILRKYIGRQLYIYELPKKGERYYAGVDTASGSGNDSSTISMIDKDGRQVLSFYDNTISVFEFAKVLDTIGRFFNYAFLVVERNGFGVPILERLRKEYQYINLFKHKVFDQKSNKAKKKLGWNTDQKSKSIMITDLKEQFECSLMLINCTETIEQMQIFVESVGG